MSVSGVPSRSSFIVPKMWHAQPGNGAEFGFAVSTIRDPGSSCSCDMRCGDVRRLAVQVWPEQARDRRCSGEEFVESQAVSLLGLSMAGFASEHAEWGEIVILAGCDSARVSNAEGEIGVAPRFSPKFEWNVVSRPVAVDWMRTQIRR